MECETKGKKKKSQTSKVNLKTMRTRMNTLWYFVQSGDKEKSLLKKKVKKKKKKKMGHTYSDTHESLSEVSEIPEPSFPSCDLFLAHLAELKYPQVSISDELWQNFPFHKSDGKVDYKVNQIKLGLWHAFLDFIYVDVDKFTFFVKSNALVSKNPVSLLHNKHGCFITRQSNGYHVYYPPDSFPFSLGVTQISYLPSKEFYAPGNLFVPIFIHTTCTSVTKDIVKGTLRQDWDDLVQEENSTHTNDCQEQEIECGWPFQSIPTPPPWCPIPLQHIVLMNRLASWKTEVFSVCMESIHLLKEPGLLIAKYLNFSPSPTQPQTSPTYTVPATQIHRTEDGLLWISKTSIVHEKNPLVSTLVGDVLVFCEEGSIKIELTYNTGIRIHQMTYKEIQTQIENYYPINEIHFVPEKETGYST